MALAQIAFDFDPDLRLGDLVVGRQTIALAAVVLIAVSLAAFLAHRLRPTGETSRGRGNTQGAPAPQPRALARDDLLLILLGVVPGSVYGARIGYVLIHLDYYAAHPGAWLDFSQGSLELGFGVIGGVVAGVAMARAIGAPMGRWLHVWAVPVLVGLGLGKFAMALGGAGQGIAADLPWATAYLGPGPWGSMLPDVPSHPAQIYEGVLDLLIAVLIGGLLLFGRFQDYDGRAFLAAITLWALARVEVAFVWRDPEVVGPFRSAQVVALVIAGAGVALFLRRSQAADRTTGATRIDRPESGGVATGSATPSVVMTPVTTVGASVAAIEPWAAAAAFEAPRSTPEPAGRAGRQRPETWVPDRSGWLTAVRTNVEGARNTTRTGAQMARPRAQSHATSPRAGDPTPLPAAATAKPPAEDTPAFVVATTETPRASAAAVSHDAVAAQATDAEPAATTAAPPRRAREPWDPAMRRRPEVPIPDRSGWLTAVPKTVDPPTRATPSGPEARTSESSSSSSS